MASMLKSDKTQVAQQRWETLTSVIEGLENRKPMSNPHIAETITGLCSQSKLLVIKRYSDSTIYFI